MKYLMQKLLNSVREPKSSCEPIYTDELQRLSFSKATSNASCYLGYPVGYYYLVLNILEVLLSYGVTTE